MTLLKTNKYWGLAAATLTIASTLIAPQAVAGSKAELGNSKVQALESQVNEMGDMLRSMQSELDAVRHEAKQPVAVAPAPVKTKDNMVFFRGGYGHNNSTRGGTLDPTNVPGVGSSGNGVVTGAIGDRDAWYFGAGFDFSLSDDLFGFANGTEVLAELMFDYKHLADKKSNGLSPGATATLGTLGFNIPAANTQNATVNQLSLAASPKIKFLKGHDFRPWLIPVGFELNIVSPPSDAITVLAPGMMFGLGADYRIWNNLYVGADARYHYTPDDVDGINTDGVTAGGYLGIGF
ncbi:MAG: porin family protein [Methylococcaceae bacterium]